MASKIKVADESCSQAFAPASCLFGWANEFGKIGALILTKSVSSQERCVIAKDLHSRHVGHAKEAPVFYSDNCCSDASWISTSLAENPARIWIDTFHLINRYSEASCAVDKERHDVFIKQVAKIITAPLTGDVVKEAGSTTFEKLTEWINHFHAKELLDCVDRNTMVTGQKLAACHGKQKMHFMRCRPPIDYPNHVENRFGSKISLHGTNKLESFWGYLKSRFPHTCGIDLGLSMLSLLTGSWNMSRDMMADPRCD